MNINKRYIVDKEGNPKEVVIPLDDYRKMEELLGWDLDDKTVKQLREAKKDRARGKKKAYVDLGVMLTEMSLIHNHNVPRYRRRIWKNWKESHLILR